MFRAFDDGKSATDAIKGDASVNMNFLAVTGTTSIDYSLKETFNAASSYAFLNYSQNMVQVTLEEYKDAISDAAIKTGMANIPPWDSTKQSVVDSYKSLFETLGTHVITGASYGGRFQMVSQCPPPLPILLITSPIQMVWAENSDSSTEKYKNFEADVHAAFNGLTQSGTFDASIKTTDEYKEFENKMGKSCSCVGGDSTFASTLTADLSAANVFDTFKSWIGSSTTHPATISYRISSLVEVIQQVADADVAKRAVDVENAFNWLVNHHEEYRTKCRFVIESDWGEVALTTPLAYILEPVMSEGDPTLMESGWVYIRAGKNGDFTRKTIEYVLPAVCVLFQTVARLSSDLF
jgi:MAC/Perforin domain